MFLVWISFFLLTSCSREINLDKKIIINSDRFKIKADLQDPFTIEWISKLEHSIDGSPEHESIVIKVINFNYSYEENKLKILDLGVYKVDKLTGFRIIFSDINDPKGDLGKRIGKWMVTFIAEKFGSTDTNNNQNEVELNNLTTESNLTESNNQININKIQNTQNYGENLMLSEAAQGTIIELPKKSDLNLMQQEIVDPTSDNGYTKLMIK